MAKSLGRFEVDRFIAAGGMGEVYQGHHVVAGTPSAIKIVGGGEKHQSALLREVRAAASLNHPGIVDVFDYGRVTETESLASDGLFEAGCLWLAMEYADCGSLDQIELPQSFEAIRRILLDVLDALAHSHARDLIHRDLKPANILLSRRPEGLTLLLADFGIAHVRATGGLVPETTETIAAPAAGTPRYMAPEQIHGDWRDQGPWTDLYALGCLAWEFATGGPLFDGASALNVAMAHLQSAPGVFEPTFEVPPHFERWIRCCLEKHPRDRFQFAAEAAEALGPGEEGLHVVLGGSAIGPMTLTSTQVVGIASAKTRQMPSVELHAIRRKDSQRPWMGTTRVPDDWRPVREPAPLGRRTELGLFALRELPLVGIDEPRDRLWERLRQCELEDTPHFAVCTGVEGVGKSRLLQWVGRRATELGLATAIYVSHSRDGGPLRGLMRSLREHFGCTGLGHTKTLNRLEQRLSGAADPTLQRELTSLFAPDPSAPTNVRFESAVERYDVLGRALALEASERPLIVLLDDVHWDMDSLALCEHLARNFAARPIYVVLSLTKRLLEEDQRLTRRLSAFAALTHPAEVELHGLSEDDHMAIARMQFGLERPLAKSLVDASGGNLAFMMCVFADWIDRDVLRAEERGWTFGHREVAFPSSLREAWGARLDRFCARFAVPERVHKMLCIAAVLGRNFDVREWDQACVAAGLGESSFLIEAFADVLGARTAERLQFGSSAATEVLVARSAQRGELQAFHLACAESVAAPARQAGHLLEGGAIQRGLEVLAPAIRNVLRESEYESVVQYADMYLAFSPSKTDRQALRTRAMRADAMRYLGETEQAEAEALKLLEFGRPDAPGAVGEGLRILAGLEHARGNLDLGIARYSEAVDSFRSAADDLGMSKSLHGRGWLHLTRGAFAQAAADFSYAMKLATETGSELDAAWSRHGRAEALVYLNDAAALDEALAALAAFETLGSRSGRGMALTTVGNALRAAGNYPEARASYEAAAAQLMSLRSHLVAFTLLHRAATELVGGDVERLTKAVDAGATAVMPPAFAMLLELIDIATKRRPIADHLARVTASSATFHPLLPMVLRRLAQLVPPAEMAPVWAVFRSH